MVNKKKKRHLQFTNTVQGKLKRSTLALTKNGVVKSSAPEGY